MALVSAYRYEGPKVKEDFVKEEAKMVAHTIENAENQGLEDEDIVRILSTRGKSHLRAIYAHYKDVTGKNIDEV